MIIVFNAQKRRNLGSHARHHDCIMQEFTVDANNVDSTKIPMEVIGMEDASNSWELEWESYMRQREAVEQT